MDIKSRNNKKKINEKILMIVICISVLPVLLGSVKRYLPKENMYGSHTTLRYIDDLYQSASYLSYVVEDINGELKESEIQNEISSRKNGYLYEYNYNKEQVEEAKTSGFEEWEYSHNEEEMKIAQSRLNKSDDELRTEIIEEYKYRIDSFMSILRSNVNVEFYLQRAGEDKPFTNVTGKTRAEFEEETLSGGYTDYIIINGSDGRNGKKGVNVSDSLMDYMNYNPSVQDRSNDFYLRIKNPLESGDALYIQAKHHNTSMNIAYASIALLVVDILCIIALLVLIKRKYSKIRENVLIKIYRKLFLDIRLLSFVAIVGLMVSTVSMVYYLNTKYIIAHLILLILLGYLSISDLSMIIETYKDNKLKDYCLDKFLIIKMASLLKESTIIKSTAARVVLAIMYLVTYSLVLYATGVSLGMSWEYNPLTISLIAVSLFMTLGIIYYVLVVGKQINTLKLSTDNIVKGNYNNNIEVKGPMVLKDIAKNVINIEGGLSTAVEKAVSSEKMKGELITNVSHELKTPLKSIIDYVDLLSKKDVDQEDKEKYISILKDKSAKLKVLIEDLFEASKAAAGVMEISMENIDSVALLRQTIGEFEDRIESSGLQFIKRIPEEKLIVYADGRKTFRVFQNLLSNILKYSMPYSRVYIEVMEEEKEVVIIFKNISQFELDFSEKEIVERFKIKDASRKSDGSGLGLAIAESLIELQGGGLNISIDGDLFKAKVSLRKGDLNRN